MACLRSCAGEAGNTLSALNQCIGLNAANGGPRSEEHTSELQSRLHLVCRLLLDTSTTEIYTLSLHDALPIFEHSNIYSRLISLPEARVGMFSESVDVVCGPDGLPAELRWGGRKYSVCAEPVHWFERRQWWAEIGRAHV